jgi:hypothetical protein
MARTRPQEDPAPPLGPGDRRARPLGDTLIHEGERYRLDRAKVHIDLDQLDQLLAGSENEPKALDAGLALWRGEPLAGSDYV